MMRDTYFACSYSKNMCRPSCMHTRQKRCRGKHVKIKCTVSIYLYKKIGYAVRTVFKADFCGGLNLTLVNVMFYLGSHLVKRREGVTQFKSLTSRQRGYLTLKSDKISILFTHALIQDFISPPVNHLVNHHVGSVFLSPFTGTLLEQADAHRLF